MNKVASSETTRDKHRLKKLEILLNKNQPKHLINTVDILNLTDFEIPQEVREILKFGRNSEIEGYQKKDSAKKKTFMIRSFIQYARTVISQFRTLKTITQLII